MTSYIGYHNLLESGTVTASTEASGFEKENAYDNNTYDYWKPTAATAYLNLDGGYGRWVDYFSLGAHDLFDNSSTVVLQYADDSAYTTNLTDAFSAVTPTDNSPIFRSFTSVNKRYWRLKLTGAVASLGDVRFGERLEIPSGIPKPFKLLSESRESTRLINKSEGGQKLGNSTIRYGLKGHSLKLRNLTPAWVRTNWPDFAEHIEKKMFVLQWDDTNYPDETGLCWLEGEVPTPTYTHELYLSATLKYGGQVR